MAPKEESVIKDLQKTSLKYIITCLIGSAGLTVLGGFSFYHNANNTLNNHDNSIQEINVKIVEHDKTINSTSSDIAVMKSEVKNIQRDIESINQNQKEIYKLLLEINSGQKTILKNQ